ncbi:MAG: GntR family transcriptional regulator [Rhizomicrobium sp.]
MGAARRGAKSHAPLSQTIRDVLEDEIVTGQLAPGTHLEEIELAERFGASRTPVREALQQMAATGVIEIRPRRGAIVPQPDPHHVLEMFEAMAELEASCAGIAARRLSEEDRQVILDAYERTRKASTLSADEYYHENEAFHLAIYMSCHNRILEDLAVSMQRRLRPYRRLQLRLPHRVGTSLAEHKALVDALLAHDSVRAAQAALDHVRVQGSGFGDLMVLLRAAAD